MNVAQSLINETPFTLLDDVIKSLETTVSYDVDPISIACARHRLHKQSGRHVMLEEVKTDMVLQEDREKARAIRQSYGQKITIALLQDEHCSKYRKELASYLTSETPNVITLDQTRMIYKLPEQYDFDQEIMTMRDKHFNKDYKEQSYIGEKELIPVKRFTRKTLKRASEVYWFKTSDTGAPVTMEIDSNNVLIGLFNKVFDTFSIMKISGKYNWKETKDNFNFYLLIKWGLNSKVISGD